jgi:uncharacterized protein
MASDEDVRLRGAAKSDHVLGMLRLIELGADPNAFLGTAEWTPLMWAANNGHVAATDALLKAGAHVDGSDAIGWTPLMLAAEHDHTGVMHCLLDAGAQLHRITNLGVTALHNASQWGRVKATRVLLEAGADVEARNWRRQRPIDIVRSLLACPFATVVTLPCTCSQVCTYASDTSVAASLRALIASTAPWSRRRPVTVACYADVWDWIM